MFPIQIKTIRKKVSFLLLLMTLTGCMVSANYRADEPIGEERVGKIKCGKTASRDILAQLGPPLVIARKTKNTSYPAPRMAYLRFVERSTEPFLELFSKDRPLRTDEAVYYYRATERNETGFLLILFLINLGGRDNEVETEHLWLLVDETSGIIEDLAYRDHDHHQIGCVNASIRDRGAR